MSQAISQSCVSLLARLDLAAVRLCSVSARPKIARRSAIALSVLGNGWMYPVIVCLSSLYAGTKIFPAIVAGLINAGVLHTLYPRLKRWIGRRRPFEIDKNLESLLRCLDEHSFPSGHVMTLTGVLVPLVLVLPETFMLSIGLVFAMGWARLAAGHHFLSDVVAGAAMGALVGGPLALAALTLT